MKDWINVALPKGRLGEKVYDMLERAGYGCPSIKENNRKLIFEETFNDNSSMFFYASFVQVHSIILCILHVKSSPFLLVCFLCQTYSWIYYSIKNIKHKVD